MMTILNRPGDAARARALNTLSTHVTLVAAVLLVLVKLAGWIATGSMALLASAVDGLVDTGASLVTLLGVRYAQRPPDRDHRFGHGKGEAVAAFTQASFVAGAACLLVFQSVGRLISPVPLKGIEIGAYLIGLSLLAACGLVAMQTWVVARTGSTAIAADRAHYLTDAGVISEVLLSFVVSQGMFWY